MCWTVSDLDEQSCWINMIKLWQSSWYGVAVSAWCSRWHGVFQWHVQAWFCPLLSQGKKTLTSNLSDEIKSNISQLCIVSLPYASSLRALLVERKEKKIQKKKKKRGLPLSSRNEKLRLIFKQKLCSLPAIGDHRPCKCCNKQMFTKQFKLNFRILYSWRSG